MAAIYKRELRSYFHSMIGPVIVAVLVAFTGVYFMAYNLNAGYPYFAYTLSGALIVFLAIIPILTMRSFSEERKNKTDQLLLTAPISISKVVLGKFFSMATVLLIPNLIFCLFPLIIKAQGNAFFLVDYTSIFSFFLLGCVYISIGMFLSSLTESTIIAAISTFGVLLVLYLWKGIMQFMPSSAISGLVGVIVLLTILVSYIFQMTKNWLISGAIEVVGVIASIVTYIVKSSLFDNLLGNWLGKLDLTSIFTGIVENNIVDVSGLVLYLSIIAVFIFLTIQTIQKRRWS
ncbi:MAG: ABC transporter permease [Hespellia sp.]|nr:ABC transporter permease [Hespellia sp.]